MPPSGRIDASGHELKNRFIAENLDFFGDVFTEKSVVTQFHL